MIKHIDKMDFAGDFAESAVLAALAARDQPECNIDLDDVHAAIRSGKNMLSAEELQVFEPLLDAPDLDREAARECLQMLWVMVVCVNDYLWDKAARSGDQNSCGSNGESASECAFARPAVVKCEHDTLTQTHSKAATKKARRKGCHDSTQ